MNQAGSKKGVYASFKLLFGNTLSQKRAKEGRPVTPIWL